MTALSGFTSRAYGGDGDLPRLARVLLEITGACPPHTSWHIGSLYWSMYFGMQFDPRRDVRLWDDEAGALQGFAWFEEPNTVSLHVRPRHRGSGLLETPMLQWAAEHAREFEQPADAKLWTIVVPTDREAIDYLIEHGFERGTDYGTDMLRELDGPIPEPRVPAGWTVRPVGDEAEWADRAKLHREVWNPSKHTLEAYRRLRTAPSYRPDLDIVAVAPDGTLASYCIIWHDPGNQIGQLEPVGTHPDFRRQGLSRAVLYEGLRRLQALGAHTAWVSTGAQSDRAIGLYEAVGFRILFRSQRYGKSYR